MTGPSLPPVPIQSASPPDVMRASPKVWLFATAQPPEYCWIPQLTPVLPCSLPCSCSCAWWQSCAWWPERRARLLARRRRLLLPPAWQRSSIWRPLASGGAARCRQPVLLSGSKQPCISSREPSAAPRQSNVLARRRGTEATSCQLQYQQYLETLRPLCRFCSCCCSRLTPCHAHPRPPLLLVPSELSTLWVGPNPRPSCLTP